MKTPVKRSIAGTVYKTRCDNHPERRAAWAFTQNGKRRGLCEPCFRKESGPPKRVKTAKPAKPAGRRRDRAIRYAEGLTTAQLLKKLKADGIDHPGRLAQVLGLPGQGTRWSVAKSISNKYGTR